MNRLPTVTGHDLPRIGWQHVARHVPEIVGPVTNGYPKPKGGLWTSPLRFDDRGQVTGTGWTEWCTGEDYGTPDAPITELHPNPDAAVYVINTPADLIAFAAVFPDSEPPWGGMWAPIDWAAAAKGGIDAVWLTDDGQWATRLSQPGMYGWDCETVFWLNPAFTVGQIIDITGGKA